MQAMARAGNSLLRPGANAAWAGIEAEQREALAQPRDSVEERLMRGQRLSAQAARLRRSVVMPKSARTGGPLEDSRPRPRLAGRGGGPLRRVA